MGFDPSSVRLAVLGDAPCRCMEGWRGRQVITKEEFFLGGPTDLFWRPSLNLKKYNPRDEYYFPANPVGLEHRKHSLQ